MKKLSILIFCFLLYPLIAVSQKGFSRFNISGTYGWSISDAEFKNPIWFEENNQLKTGFGRIVKGEVNQRVIGNLWLGVGYGGGINKFIYTKTNPFDPQHRQTVSVKKGGIELLSLKAEYLQPFKKNFLFANYTFVNYLGLAEDNHISSSQGTLVSSVEYGYLFEGNRSRSRLGLGYGRYMGKAKRIGLKVEGNYSFFNDFRKSNIIDKMNIKTSSVNLSLTYFLKPVIFN